MERIDYLKRFGECVRKIRKEKKMNQVEFYHFLYPEENKEEENIKKWMNKIENGKMKSLNTDFIIRFCCKCDVSADYLLGIERSFKNHETEFVNSYTGLDESAIQQLHKWNLGKNNGSDISSFDSFSFDYNNASEDEIKKNEKKTGVQFLKIINYLFESPKNYMYDTKDDPYPHLTILDSLYLMIMAKPTKLCGNFRLIEDEEKLPANHRENYVYFDEDSLNAKAVMFLYDTDNNRHVIFGKHLLEEIGKKNLLAEIERLVEQIKEEERRTGEET